MSLTLPTVTNFAQFIKSARCVLITSDDLNNSNFIINQYIQVVCKGSNHQAAIQLNQSNVPPTGQPSATSHAKTQGNKVFGIFLNQSYTSYSFIQMKCGYNLKNLKERKQFRCLDVVSELQQFLVRVGDDCDADDQFDFARFKSVLLDQLMEFFELDAQATSRPNDASRVLIIDDITVLLSFNIKLNDLVNFMNYLKHFAARHHISLIIQTYVDASRLDQLVKLDTYLNSISDLVLLASKLETGYSNKVDGNLEIKNYITNTQQTYLFKSTERTTKLYSPGTI